MPRRGLNANSSSVDDLARILRKLRLANTEENGVSSKHSKPSTKARGPSTVQKTKLSQPGPSHKKPARDAISSLYDVPHLDSNTNNNYFAFKNNTVSYPTNKLFSGKKAPTSKPANRAGDAKRAKKPANSAVHPKIQSPKTKSEPDGTTKNNKPNILMVSTRPDKNKTRKLSILQHWPSEIIFFDPLKPLLQWSFKKLPRMASYVDIGRKVQFTVSQFKDKTYIYLDFMYFQKKKEPLEIPARALISGLRAIADVVSLDDASYILMHKTPINRYLLPDEKFNIYRGATPTYDNMHATNKHIMALRAYIKSRIDNLNLTEKNLKLIELSRAHQPVWNAFWDRELQQPRVTNYESDIVRISHSMPPSLRTNAERQFIHSRV